MSQLEFIATIRNGDIVITDELRQALLAQAEGQTVRIIIPAKNLLRDAREKGYTDTSLIVAAALQAGASILYSEDMHNGLVIDKQLTIINPFTSQ